MSVCANGQMSDVCCETCFMRRRNSIQIGTSIAPSLSALSSLLPVTVVCIIFIWNFSSRGRLISHGWEYRSTSMTAE